MNELAGLETFVSFLFLFFVLSCLCTKLKINTVLLLPQTTNNSTVPLPRAK